MLGKMQLNHHKICIFQVKMGGMEVEQQDTGEQKEGLTGRAISEAMSGLPIGKEPEAWGQEVI